MADIRVDFDASEFAAVENLQAVLTEALRGALRDVTVDAAREVAKQLQRTTPRRTGRLHASLEVSAVVPARGGPFIDIRGIFYTGPVNRRTQFIDKAVSQALPAIGKLIIRAFHARLRRSRV